MDNQQQPNRQEITPEQAIAFLYQAINKATKHGAFEIEEVYNIKLVIDSLKNAFKKQ